MTKTKLYTPEAGRFDRSWWFGTFRNALFVAIITVLIWAYADLENTEDGQFNAAIVLATRSSKDLTLLSAQRVETTFKLRGTSSSLMIFRRELENHPEIRHDVSQGYAPGIHMIPTAEILAANDLVSKSGLTVISAAPKTILIDLDRLVQLADVPVEPKFTGGRFAEDTPPKVQPAKVTIRVASSDLNDLPKGDSLRLTTSPVDLKNVPTGEEVTREAVIIAKIGGIRVWPEPPTVRVTVQVSERTEEKTISLAVHLRLPHTWTQDHTWEQYKLVRKDPLEWQPQVTVHGAQKHLDRLRAEEIEAHVVLTEDDKRPVESWLKRPVTVHFPAGMDLEIVGEKPTVHFKLEKRTVPSPAP